MPTNMMARICRVLAVVGWHEQRIGAVHRARMVGREQMSRPARQKSVPVEGLRDPQAPSGTGRRHRPRDGGRGAGKPEAMPKPDAVLPGPWAAARRLQQTAQEAESIAEFIERHRLLWAEEGSQIT